MSIKKEDLTKIPVETARIPKDGYVVYKDRHWVVMNDCILLFRNRSPQCNYDKGIAEMVQKKLYPDATVQFIEFVYLPQVN